jgi:hypothetical protein
VAGKFAVRPITAEMAERHRREYEFDAALPKAYAGDIDPLCDFLLAVARREVNLRFWQAGQLAEFLQRRRKQLARYGKRDVPDPVRAAEKFYLHEVRQLKRERYGDGNVPRGGWDRLFAELDRQLERAGYDLPPGFRLEKVRVDLKRSEKPKRTSRRIMRP